EHVRRQGLGGGWFVEHAAVDGADVGVESGECGGEVLAEEAVGGGEAAGKLVGVQVPSLVEAAFEGASHEPCMFGPRRPHGVDAADGKAVGGAVGEPHSPARGGDLHELLGEVGGRVVHALVGARDAETGAVVVGAEVQAAATAVGSTQDRRQRHGAV